MLYNTNSYCILLYKLDVLSFLIITIMYSFLFDLMKHSMLHYRYFSKLINLIDYYCIEVFNNILYYILYTESLVRSGIYIYIYIYTYSQLLIYKIIYISETPANSDILQMLVLFCTYVNTCTNN